ncbi:M14 family metallopeptidase [Mucilaginibacter sp. RB4R14]|uniref:M14 family metallopeptidase n=1 Tax=Mucilaginibacter aurantiaciroseus TaxID=2949308 RepID=UPI002091DDF8|nr:M14 family metallopeptidase [Mucilaginibacter aurantiaciroseus]MCO5936686.1 M14 family metallopeptidase [Mucilaginibacter aurantiaciroseus]
MIKKLLFVIIAALCGIPVFAQELQSPEQFLGYKLGDKFTPHYRVVEYFKYVAQTAKNTHLQQFGTTNEGRPLLAMFIASDDNIKRLEEIRHNNLRIAGIESGAVIPNSPVITWLSYNVHGNEPASSEAAMWTLFDLTDPLNAKSKEWLKNSVVVIDPCLNPDGRDRYVNFYNSVRGVTPDASPSSREHTEPWPGGRVNHYYFDLNRDWAWQAQKETQASVGLFNQWLPEVHVDFHEQGYNNPYYFAPAAEPYHKDITQWQRDFQVVIGKNNAKYFDQNGWMYFTKQEFDLLYPSYGDTYPLYNGSIGMTYEQGGISAGLAVVTRSGDTLTLVQRIAHHHTTGLSTVEVVSANAQKVVDEFKKFYDNSRQNPPGQYKTYVIKNDNNEKVNELAKMLTRNGIQFGYGLANKSVTGYNYFTGATEQYNVEPNDLVVNAYQPKSVLLHVLLEPKTFIPDSATYDITAWALPYAYGLKAYGVKESYKAANTNSSVVKPAALSNTKGYAYVSAWQSIADVRFLSALLKRNIKVRYSELPFEAKGKKFTAGSLLVTRAGNEKIDFDRVVTQLAADMGHEITPLSSGFVDKGSDIGSFDVKFIKQPHVALFTGDGINSEAMGEVWHFFEQQIGYPINLIRYQDINRIKLADYDVLIMPDGRYNDLTSDNLQKWVSDGGKLIAMENAVASLVDKKGFDIKKKESKKDDKPDLKAKQSIKLYVDRNRDAIRSSIPGAIFKLNMDNTHPLGFGFPNYYYSLKLSDDIYELLGDDDWNVGTIENNGYVAGFAGVKSKQKVNNGMLLGVQSLGHGSVVYLVDDPLFRSFWENGKLLFSNAVFMVGQ